MPQQELQNILRRKKKKENIFPHRDFCKSKLNVDRVESILQRQKADVASFLQLTYTIPFIQNKSDVSSTIIK